MIAESRRNAPGESVRGDVGKRDEESPFDEEDPCGRQHEDSVLEDPPIGPDVLNDVTVFRWLQTAAYEQVGDAEEEEEEECEDPRRPPEADFGEETLEHQRKDDATHTTAGGSETCSSGAASGEEVCYGADRWGEDEGGAHTAEDGVCQDEVPEF